MSAPRVSQDGTAALINVVPAGSPTSDVTRDLVGEARDEVIPAGGVDAHVGGSTAQQLDLADLIGQRLPLIIAVVVALSMVLLLVAFRLAIVPLQAALVNLLAVGAAYGLLTAVFQEGNGAAADRPGRRHPDRLLRPDDDVRDPLRARDELPGVPSQPRARGDRCREVAAPSGRRRALAGHGKVTASAAAIMVAVFASFILNGDPTVKEFGVGLASAILIAGTMVCVLLPAVMLLMGKRAPGGCRAAWTASRRTSAWRASRTRRPPAAPAPA